MVGQRCQRERLKLEHEYPEIILLNLSFVLFTVPFTLQDFLFCRCFPAMLDFSIDYMIEFAPFIGSLTIAIEQKTLERGLQIHRVADHYVFNELTIFVLFLCIFNVRSRITKKRIRLPDLSTILFVLTLLFTTNTAMSLYQPQTFLHSILTYMHPIFVENFTSMMSFPMNIRISTVWIL